MALKTIFMGSDEIAIPSLKGLLETDSAEIVAVVTQPDRPKGRKRRLTPCPLNKFAKERGLPLLTPEKIACPEAQRQIAELDPDLFAVAAYGQYIPASITSLAPRGAINMHPSLLPRYRGAAPIQWALANGDTQSGVSIINVSEELDAGDILLQRAMNIRADDTAASLGARLADLGAEMFSEAIRQLDAGSIEPTPQNSEQVLYARKLKKTDGEIDWTWDASDIHNRVRGFNPWPGCYSKIKGKAVKIWRTELNPAEGTPGEVIRVDKKGPLVATGRGSLRILCLQPPGKKRMDGGAFLNGHPLKPGTLLS